MTSASRILGSARAVKPVQAWSVLGLAVLIAAIILGARGLEHLSSVKSFMLTYPGASEISPSTPVGFPVWVNVQHGLNALFMVFIITSGYRVRTNQRPRQFFTRTVGPMRSKPTKISMDLWLHLTMDTLWIINGIVFYALIFATGQWRRVIPTHWDVFPNMCTAIIQYASFDWPTEHGWTNYNAIQLLTYFVVIFVAAPLSLLTGLRMSPSWPKNTERLNKIYPIEAARKVHYPIMLFFALFIVVHVILVLTTGALRNLNHMYGSSNDESWFGFGMFVLTVVVITGLVVAARPMVLRPIASLTGKVSR